MSNTKFYRGDIVVNSQDPDRTHYRVIEYAESEYSGLISVIKEEDWEDYNREICPRTITTISLIVDSVQVLKSFNCKIGDSVRFSKENIPAFKRESLEQFFTLTFRLENIVNGSLILKSLHFPNQNFTLFKICPSWVEKASQKPIERMKQKPPLGLLPRHIFIEERQEEIEKAMQRYIASKENIPFKWIEEYIDNNKFLINRENKKEEH